MAALDFLRRITGQASELSEAAIEKLNKVIDEYQKALAILGTFGFTVGKLQMEAGLVPAIRTSLHGSVKAIRTDAVKQLVDEHEDSKLVAQMLNALLTAKRLSEQFQLKTDSISMDVNLGLSPKIGISFD